MDRLTCMQTFIRVVESGSISAAAGELDQSSQLTGKQLRMLEQNLGIQLINRTTRSQSLTDSGRLFYERAKNILAEMDEAEAVIAETRAIPRGNLRISAPITFGSQLLASKLPEYLKQNPEVSLELCLSNRTVDLVEERFDAVFRTGELADSQLLARALAPYQMVICAAPAYLEEAGTPSVPQDLTRHQCLIFTHTSMRTEWKFEGPGGQVSVPVTGRFKTDNSEALLAAALSGLGIIMQPLPLMSADIAAGRLVRVLPDYELPGRPVHVLYAQDRRMTPRLRSFIDFCITHFGS
ncbi:LysR substrate-binding domain-containing protein [Citrobacter youngae]|uniref:LysR substrate-binding domain-containing protein n=1 Tax=Citrobacter youngae TaxID=133448 RepID=UPI00115C9F4B|nr:LysR substrate-binding domain-containing protein [Citrobacter youngae]MBK6259806.1 LysR family transcriptional regulator [Citrobacter youngae]TRL62754.1 LysR family transcriptional regulator [Citrobacter youngae]